MSGRNARGGVNTRGARYPFHVEHGAPHLMVRERLLPRVFSSRRVPRGTPERWAGWRVGRSWLAQVRARFHVEHADDMGVPGMMVERARVPCFEPFHVERGWPHGHANTAVGRSPAHDRASSRVPRGTWTRLHRSGRSRVVRGFLGFQFMDALAAVHM